MPFAIRAWRARWTSFTQCFGKQQPVSPHTFLHVLWATAESFAGYEQQDAHEFLTALLAAIDNGIKLAANGAAGDGSTRIMTTSLL